MYCIIRVGVPQAHYKRDVLRIALPSKEETGRKDEEYCREQKDRIEQASRIIVSLAATILPLFEN